MTAPVTLNHPEPVLSVCIASMKRPLELQAQLQLLFQQIDTGSLPVEVVVVDASPEELRCPYEHPKLKMLYLEAPRGIDKDYDAAVQMATGSYCWLLPDDDSIDVSALSRILQTLSSDPKTTPSLVLLNAVVHDPNGHQLADSIHPKGLFDGLAAPVRPADLWRASSTLNYIGSVVVSRQLWNERQSSKYFGSEFVHVGVLLSADLPGPCFVIREPLITIVYGRAHWEKRAALVWLSQWPVLIASLGTIPTSSQPSNCSLAGLFVDALHFRALGSLTKRVVAQVTKDQIYPRKHLFIIQAVAVMPTSLCLAAMRVLVRVFPSRIDSLKTYNVRTRVEENRNHVRGGTKPLSNGTGTSRS
jgi:abequosyltransferase